MLNLELEWIEQEMLQLEYTLGNEYVISIPEKNNTTRDQVFQILKKHEGNAIINILLI